MIPLDALKHLAVVDVETTGLDPDQHEIWEVALYLPDLTTDPSGAHRWFLPVDLGKADIRALSLGRFYERTSNRNIDGLDSFAREFEALTRGRHLVGNVVSFDEERLRKLLRANGACPGWHYHLVDVEAIAAGALGVTPPWSSKDLSEQLGVAVPTADEAHGAARDVRWAWEMYVAAMELSWRKLDPHEDL